MLAPLKVCAVPRCPNTTRRTHCDQHQREQKQQHSRFYRGGGFYGRRWRAISQRFLAEHPFCVGLNGQSCGRLAEHTDHRTPHRGNRELFWDESNWQPLCPTCHGIKTAGETLGALSADDRRGE